MRRIALAGLAASAGLLLWLASAQADTRLPDPPRPGTFQLTLRSGGFTRVAHVHVPKGYKPGAKPPLVLVLHGAGGSGTGILEQDRWAAKADKEGFVAVAPDGLPARPRLPANFRTNPAVWNSGQLKPGSPRAAIDDVAFVRALLNELKTRVPYDPGRVFCTGHSNGGGMTFRLAAELPERFAAVGTVAGRVAVKDPRPKKPLPTLFIIGTKDPLMPLAGGAVKSPWGGWKNPPVAEQLAAWAKAIGCQTEPKTLSDKGGLKTVEYPSRGKGPTLRVIYIAGHGHHWPGGKRTLPESTIGPITRTMDATDALWEFFHKAAAGGSR